MWQLRGTGKSVLGDKILEMFKFGNNIRVRHDFGCIINILFKGIGFYFIRSIIIIPYIII